MRVDARVHLATGGGLNIKVATNPVIVIGSPNGGILRGLNGPQVQITNFSGQPSSLFSTPDNFSTFQSSGSQKVVAATFGYFVRF